MRTIERFYASLLVTIFGLIVLHAPLTVWLGTLFPTQTILIKSWKELLLIPATLIAIYLVTKHKKWRQLSGDLVFKAVIVYAAVHVITITFLYTGLNSTLAGLGIDLRYILYFSLVYTLILLTPRYKGWLLKIGLIGALLVSGFALLQVTVLPRDILVHIGYEKNVTIAPFLTVDDNPDFVRINSTLRGPNPLGAYLVIVLSLLTAFWLRGNHNVFRRPMGIVGVLGVGGLVGLWASYSRSALLSALLAIGLVAVLAYGKKFRTKHWTILGLVSVLVIGGLVIARDTSFVSNVLLHENATTGADISSNEGHVDSLVDGGTRLLSQPFGAGVGSTGSASLYGGQGVIIENQYLFIAHEVGWLGLAIFVTIFSVILTRLYKRRDDWLALGLFASGIGLGVIGLLLPVWADDTVSIIWWGLAGVALAAHVKADKIKS